MTKHFWRGGGACPEIFSPVHINHDVLGNFARKTVVYLEIKIFVDEGNAANPLPSHTPTYYDIFVSKWAVEYKGAGRLGRVTDVGDRWGSQWATETQVVWWTALDKILILGFHNVVTFSISSHVNYLKGLILNEDHLWSSQQFKESLLGTFSSTPWKGAWCNAWKILVLGLFLAHCLKQKTCWYFVSGM